LPTPAETVHISQPIEASHVAQADADRFPGLTTAEVSRKPSILVAAPQEKSSRKVSGGLNLLRKEGHTRRAGDLPEQEESTRNALGSAYARGRLVEVKQRTREDNADIELQFAVAIPTEVFLHPCADGILNRCRSTSNERAT
jgi:hypothetical protein